MTDSDPTKAYGLHHGLAVTASKHTVTQSLWVITLPCRRIKEMSQKQQGHSAQQDIPSWPMTHLAQYGPFRESAFQCALHRQLLLDVTLSTLCKEQASPHSYRNF